MKKEDALLKSSKLNEAGMEISSSPQTDNIQLQLDDDSSSDENSSFEDDENEMSPEEEPSTPPHHSHSKACQVFCGDKMGENHSGSSMSIVATSSSYQQLHFVKGKMYNAAPKEDKVHNLKYHSPSGMFSSSAESQMDASGSSFFSLNLALLSPFLENFAMSSEHWLGNFMESYPSDLSLPSMGFSEPNYDFLGNLFSGDIHSLDAFGSTLSGNPDNCSLEFCYKLLYQRLSLSEAGQKTYARIKEVWKDVLVSLRNLEWKKAQGLLADLDLACYLPSEYVFRNAPAVVMWSPGGRIHHANGAFCYLSGYSLEDLKVSNGFDGGKINANHLFHTTEITKILQKQLEAFQSSKSCVCSFLMRTKLLTKAKQEISISCSINNLRDSFGVPILTTMLILS